MKLIALLILVGCLQVSATVSGQEVTLSALNAPFKSVLQQIQRQTGYAFLISEDLLNSANTVNLQLEHVELEKALPVLFSGQPFTYEVADHLIKVLPVENATPRADVRAGERLANRSPLILALPESKGRVVDSAGNALAGASVRVLNAEGKRTALQTTTDRDGNFTLQNVPEDARLEITYIGYTAQTLTARPNVGQITLQALPSALEEVTVSTGYWKTSQRLNTGNIAKVSAEEIARQPVGNPLSTLEGNVPGLLITQTTGIPGGAIKVELRGRTAIDRNITDDQPLFIVDDIPFGPNNGWLNSLPSALGQPRSTLTARSQGGASPFNSLNPADIESIEVLKDADATAIYGSRGANGVIRITTKRGYAGKTKFDFNAYTGISNLARPVAMMDNRQFVAMRKQAFANDNIVPTLTNAFDLLAWDTTRNTDFVDLLSGNTAHTHNMQLSVSGGNSQTQFLISGNYRKETTIMPGNFANNRSGINFLINHQSVDQRFKLTFGGTYNADENNLPTADPMTSLLSRLPHTQVYHADGSLAWNEGGFSGSNPLAFMLATYRSHTILNQGNLQLSYNLNRNLVLKTNLGYSSNHLQENSRTPAARANPNSTTPIRTADESTNNFQSYIIEPQINYNLTGRLGRIDALVGGSWQRTDNKGTTINASGFSTDALMSSLTAAIDYTATNRQSEYRYAAAFGRIGYDWQNRYLFNFSARRDGSSRFGDGSRYANFGAIGAAWIFSEEKWIVNRFPFLSFGKLRTSIGLTGNDKITDYQFLNTWMATASPYDGAAGLYPNKLFNPDYRWEKTTKWEAALEASLFDDRFSFSAVYFRHQSANQLTNYRLSSTAGFTSVVANLPAKVENTGWEFVLSSTNIKTASFTWTSSFNATIPRNRLVSFPGLAASSYANTYVEGQSLNLIQGYRYLGVDPESGVFTFEDVDGNGLYNTADYQVLGSLDPESFGGFQNTVRYKQFELNVFASFRIQRGRSYIASITSGSQAPGSRSLNLPAKMTGFWENPGDRSTLQRLTTSTYSSVYSGRFIYSSGIYSDASFARLRNVELSYRIPAAWLSRLKLQQARIYAQGQNLLTFTGYEIGDPETQWLTRTPPLRVFSFGIHLTF